jgi:hypothetical protein
MILFKYFTIKAVTYPPRDVRGSLCLPTGAEQCMRWNVFQAVLNKCRAGSTGFPAGHHIFRIIIYHSHRYIPDRMKAKRPYKTDAEATVLPVTKLMSGIIHDIRGGQKIMDFIVSGLKHD